MGISAILIIMVFAGANIAYPEYHPVDRLINVSYELIYHLK